jgi:alpha-tubulin suppressor-like RCC1 family protein
MGGGVVMYVVNGQLFVSMATAYANGAGRDGLSGLENMTQVALPAKVVDMFTTGWASWVLLENKELWVCGLNTYGALGIGDTTSPAYFVKSTDNVDQMYYSPSMLDRGSSVAANRMFIRKGAQLYGAGYNANGALGIGTTANASSWTLVPIPVDGDTLVRNLGAQFGCLVVVRRRTMPSAGVWVCGYNGARQLGTPVAGNVLTLTDVSSEWGLGGSSLNTIVDAQGGFGYATTAESGNSVLFIRNGFEIMACGYGAGGLLGNGGTASTTVPVLAHQTTSRIKQFTVHGGGFGHAFSVHEDGSVFCWGSNQNGQLGLGDTAQRNSPTNNPALTGKTIKVATQTSRNQYSHNGGILFDMRDTEGHQVLGYTGGTSYGENAGDTPSSGVMFPRLPVFDSRGERIVYEHFGVGATASATVGLATFVAVTDRGAVYSWGHNNQGLVYLPAANLGALFTAPHPWERNNV